MYVRSLEARTLVCERSVNMRGVNNRRLFTLTIAAHHCGDIRLYASQELNTLY